jgi:hypothetical protein
MRHDVCSKDEREEETEEGTKEVEKAGGWLSSKQSIEWLSYINM